MLKVLIANRGEIAVRVVRACAHEGIASVAVYADQDIDALHVRLADEAIALGGRTAADTYLDINAVLAAAQTSGADAVHPGYGFLAESAEFARAVEAAGLTWIGPSAASIDALGDKVTARGIAQQVGAPLVPGSDGPVPDAAAAIAFADEHGLPIAIKAAFGGGGRGLRVARSRDEIADAFESATREALAAFGRGECFVERFLERPRHVEVQVLGDGEGGIVTVGDRDCSLQRRNQKLVEEAPAPGLTPEQRERIHTAARDICSAVAYRGAGTVEFLMGEDGTISFLEVNTRLQVEHPVTEEVTGIDLVREQLRIARGLGPSITATPAPVGHAIELRINAEDPGRGFLPSPGRIAALEVPGGPGVRWDAGVLAGDSVQPAFDSLMAKLIVHGRDRDEALARCLQAARELRVEGPATVVPFQRALLSHPDFQTAAFAVHTQWIETVVMDAAATQPRPAPVAAERLERVAIEIDGRRVELGLPAALLGTLASGVVAPAPAAADARVVEAPTPGALVEWLVDEGAHVAAGDEIAVLDAMKMETRVTAHRSGTIERLVAVGDHVQVQDALARIVD